NDVEYMGLKLVTLALNIQKIFPRQRVSTAQIRITGLVAPVVPNVLSNAVHGQRPFDGPFNFAFNVREGLANIAPTKRSKGSTSFRVSTAARLTGENRLPTVGEKGLLG